MAVAVHRAGAIVDDTTTGTKMSVGVLTVLLGSAVVLKIVEDVADVRQLKAMLPGIHGGKDSAAGGGGTLEASRQVKAVLPGVQGSADDDDEDGGGDELTGGVVDAGDEATLIDGAGVGTEFEFDTENEDDAGGIDGLVWAATGVGAAEEGSTDVGVEPGESAPCLFVRVTKLVFSEAVVCKAVDENDLVPVSKGLKCVLEAPGRLR